MRPLQLEEILPHIGGILIKEGTLTGIKKVITNPKKLKDGALLFCLGSVKNLEKDHSFPPCTIVSERVKNLRNLSGDVTIVKVKKIKKAYEDFLSYYRSLFSIPVIAITGTYGKTTTKEMIKHILSDQYKVKATKRNYNLFRSNASVLANFDAGTDFGVFEFGVGKKGNLERCSRCFGPYTALITGIGADHIERFGTIENYILEKSRILNGVGENQLAILNADCQNTLKITKDCTDKKFTWFGLGEKANYRAQNIQYTDHGMEFTLTFNHSSYLVNVQGYGIHNVYDALAAIAATHSYGIDLGVAVERLKSFKQLERHLEVSKGLKGTTLIDDSWNTNSGSVQAALTVLKDLSKGKTTIAVLGKISELGLEEENEHKKIAQLVVDHKIDKLVTIGNTASIISNEALRLGMDSHNIFICKDEMEATTILEKISGSNSIILVKTSMRESFGNFLKELKKQL